MGVGQAAVKQGLAIGAKNEVLKKGLKLFRYDLHPKNLFEKGIRHYEKTPLELQGLYAVEKLSDLPPLVHPGKKSGLASTKKFLKYRERYSPHAEVLRLELDPNARVLDMSHPEDWTRFLEREAAAAGHNPKIVKAYLNPKINIMPFWGEELNAFNKTLQKELSRNYDAVKFPDIVEGQKQVQTVILNKGVTTAKRKGKTYQLGLAGALGLGGSQMGLFSPEEAEASPLKPIVKAAGSRVLGSLSSASSRLQGRTYGDKVIKAIHQGRGDWRTILFTDGTEQAVTKNYINSLCMGKGTEIKMAELATKGSAGKLRQAEKSLKFHMDRAWLPETKPILKAKRQRHLNRVGEMDVAQPDLVGVWKGKTYLTMPRKYAELLEKAGRIRIDRAKDAAFKLKPIGGE